MSRIVRQRPCGECPWRLDVPEGAFPVIPAARAQQDGSLEAPIVACHKTDPGKDLACAGWLAVEGHASLRVRLAVIQGRIPGEALSPGADWPELVSSMAEMEKRHPPAVT